MKDIRLDAKLIAAAPHRGADTNSTFTAKTMQRIHMTRLIDTRTKYKKNFLNIHKLAFSIYGVLLIGTTGFTGYAYANGTNPIHLITRIVTGNHIQATYQGHTYEYGKTRNYSDAAITAYGELNTVKSLAFRANDSFGAVKDGIEYIPDDTGSGSYIYPSLATVTDVGATTSLKQTYLMGDKMNPSRSLDTPLTVDTANVQYYTQGNPSSLSPAATSRLVALFPQKYLKHTIATNSVEHVTVYFAFTLNHPQADYEEALQTSSKQTNSANVPIYEPGWGGESSTCLNNPNDACSNDKIGHLEGQGLYKVGAATAQKGYVYNPDASKAMYTIDPTSIYQHTQGKITAITNQGFTIQSSSKQLWQVAYSADQQAQFAATYTTLKIGDTIAIGTLQSIYDLNNRSFDTGHIEFMTRL